MQAMKATGAQEARKEAKDHSKGVPGVYVTIAACLGLFIVESKRLHVFAPSDAPEGLKFYYLNGIEKPFTKAQIIQDQNKTPSMS